MIRTNADRPGFDLDEYLERMQVLTQEEYDAMECTPDVELARKQRASTLEYMTRRDTVLALEYRQWVERTGV